MVILRKVFSRKPLLIIKLMNLSNVNSKVLVYSDLLFLKQIGISTILVIKNDVIVDCLKNIKFSKVIDSCGTQVS